MYVQKVIVGHVLNQCGGHAFRRVLDVFQSKFPDELLFHVLRPQWCILPLNLQVINTGAPAGGDERGGGADTAVHFGAKSHCIKDGY